MKFIHYQSIRIEQLSHDEQAKEFEKFISLGWKHVGYQELGSHRFATFGWPDDLGTAKFPEGYQTDIPDQDRIDLNQLALPCPDETE